MMSGKVSVRWWNHRNAIHKAVRELQHQEMFADIILVCEGKKVEAHKFVLSACSDYFYKELQEMPYRGLFYLPAEINEKHLPSLLDYIYGGEAIVDENEVNDLLKAAETLSIRGLAIPFSDQEEEDEESEEENHKNNVRKMISHEKGSAAKRTKADTSLGKESSGDQDKDTDIDNKQQLDIGSGKCLRSKSQSNLDVNKMLSVVLNGEQNSSRTVGKEVSGHDSREERVLNPNLKCPHCQRQFHWRSNLTKHIRIHTGEKPYTCPNCDYKTGYSEALKRHIRTHTGERPYECSLCDYKCKDNSSLKLHMNKHTGASSFPCKLCPYKTRIRSAFEKHMVAYHHPKLDEPVCHEQSHDEPKPDASFPEEEHNLPYEEHDVPPQEPEQEIAYEPEQDIAYHETKQDIPYPEREEERQFHEPQQSIVFHPEQDMTYHEPKQNIPYEPKQNVPYEPKQNIPYEPKQGMSYHDPKHDIAYRGPKYDMAFEPRQGEAYREPKQGMVYPVPHHDVKVEVERLQANAELPSLGYDDIQL